MSSRKDQIITGATVLLHTHSFINNPMGHLKICLTIKEKEQVKFKCNNIYAKSLK